VPRLSVVIPTRDRADILAVTLASLRAQEGVAGECEIVVVDNGSSDGTSEVLRRAADGPGLPLRSLREPRPGPAAARNAGVRAARGAVVLFLGDDTRPADPRVLGGHLQAHDGGPMGVLGRVRWDPALEVTPFMRWLDSSGLQFAYGRLLPGRVDPVRYLYTAHVSLPKELLLDVGGFDERFTTAAVEDLELGLRLSRRGFTLVYDPALDALHNHHTTYVESLLRTERVGAAAARFHAIHGASAHPAVGRPSRRRRRALRLAATLLAGSHPAQRLPPRLRSFRWRIVHSDAFSRGLTKAEENLLP
jgi:glycosyltransferase involved in cell wall biosynthesis